MASSVLAKMAVIIDGQTAQFNKAMAQSQNQLASFTGGIKQVGAALGITFGAAAIFNGLKAAVGIMADFEKTMSEVKAITGATGAEFDKLQADALRLGASTKYTASQVGTLQVAYGRLGFNTQEILDATEATLDLAAATGEDLAKSADVAGSTVRGFGLDARETQRVVDVMAASFNKTALGLDNFTESMKYVAPIAEAANVSVEETTALLGVLADAGIRGSQAGTALRKIFGDLSKDGRPVSERLDELGKKGITLKDSFDEVGRTAQTALLVLSKNRDKAAELTRAFSDVEGEAAKMARTMQDNLSGDVTKLSSAWEGLILSLSKTGPLRDATQALTAFISALAGGQADVISGLDQLARGVKEGVTESNGGFQLLLDKIKEIRRETGKPIDTGIAQELGDKYKLTEDQANILYRAILDINKALSLQETAIKQFN
ncbi:MAG TPA: phage tail tape measure protein, partial [Ohtaekwangia sp.]|nr:phage tail tape measure protein [Ohtaekwangia sp.]